MPDRVVVGLAPVGQDHSQQQADSDERRTDTEQGGDLREPASVHGTLSRIHAVTVGDAATSRVSMQ
jgi:hypothetical protein